MYCPKCGQDAGQGKFCSSCGSPIEPIIAVEQISSIPTHIKKKASARRAIIILSIIGAFIVFVAVIACTAGNNTSINENQTVILDAMSFWKNEERTATISETELIQRLGEPDAVEEWNYKTDGELEYPIKTLIYGDWRYNFNNNMVQWISADGLHIPYDSKDEILAMFNLKKYKNSEITDTGFAYRVQRCGIRSFWVAIMTDTELNSIRISYGDILG
jgi:hypothetical protein